MDNYTFLKQIQKCGNFGAVHHIKRKSDDKSFVVKIISKSQTKNLKHIRREVDIMSKVDHKYIIKMHAKHETYDSVNIIMEKCTGGDLFDRIKFKGRFKENEAKSVIKMVCSALYYMHNEHRIIHRDLKPENILFLTSSINSDIKIIDFGHSRFLHRFTTLRGHCGTPYYSAPEIIRQETHSPGVDMWSVGVITYAMIFGFPPFCADSNEYVGNNEREAIYNKILGGFNHIIKEGYGPWYPKELVGCISRECVAFMSGCMETNTKKRLNAKNALEHAWITGNYKKRKYKSKETKINSFFDDVTSSHLECCLNVFL